LKNTTTATGTKGRNKSLIRFIASLIIGLVAVFFLKEPEFSDSQSYVLFLLVFAIGLWFTEAIPAFAVGLFIMAFLVFALGNKNFNSEPQKIDMYVNTFSSSIIWLMLGGFFLASAMTRTKLDETLLKFTLRISGSNPRNLLMGLMVTTMLASMLMSNTATTAMVVAAVTPLIMNLGKNSGVTKALLLGVTIAASTGGMATVIGSPPNLIAAGALENEGIIINFLEWMKFGLPVTLILMSVCYFVLVKIYLKDSTPIVLDFLENKKEHSHEIIIQRRIVIIILFVTVLMWLTGNIHGIGVAAVAAIPIVFLTLTRIISNKDVQALPWDTLLLVAGGLSLGVALRHTGLLDHYAGKLNGLNFSPTAFLLIFALLTMILANIMSHTATATILIPLGITILPELKMQVALIIGLASSTAMFLPVSTPPNAIVYSTGMLEQKDFRIPGIILGLLGPILILFWVSFMS
jgi:sodium-dependent dicarboxylate transporter 2/3/5